MTSRLNSQQNSLTFGNTNTHIFTEFSTLNKESTQQEVLQAIKDINISAEIGEITVESSDTITHERLTNTNTKLDTLHNDLTSIDGKIDGVLTTDASNNLLVYSSNIASTPLITGFSLEETQQAIKVKTDDLTFSDNDGVIELRVFDSQNNISLNTINDTITNKHLDSSTDSVTVSGTVSIDTTGLALESTLQSIDGKINNDSILTDAIQVAIKNTSLDVNTGLDISGLATETKQDTQIEELQKVVDKKGDIEANIFLSQGSQVTADTAPPMSEYQLNPFGWAYENTSPGNAMNLFYFNGADETKTLNQCVGMYSVVTNLSTKLNNSLIFAIYTKGSPFFTTRVTHSPVTGVNLTAGGAFLCYWGEVPDDIYPNLPRLNFTSVITTGPGLPTEEILSVSLNTDSGAPAGDVLIFVQSLGVVFNNGSVNQSRVLNLLSNKTEYVLTSSIAEFGQQINTYLSSLTKTNDALDVYVKNDTAIPVSFSGGIDVNNFPATQAVSGSVDIGNFPATQAISGSVDIGNFPATQAISGSVNVDNFPATQAVSGSVDIGNFPATQPVSGTVAISNTSIPVTGTFFQTTQPISGSVSVSNLPATQPISGSVSVSNFPATQPISGSISNSFTLDTTTQSSNTKLDTIHSDLDGLTFDGSSNLNVNVVSGSITVSSVSVSNFPATQPVSGTVAISNTSVDTASDLYAFDGTTRRRVLCDASSRLFSVSNTRDGNNNPITSTTTTSTTQSLDTASSLYVADGTTRTALSSTGSSLNANITNSSLTTSVSNSFTLDTTTQSTNTKIDSTNTKLDTGNGYLNTINNATGDFTTTTAFGNFISNVSLTGGSDSVTSTFTRGSLKRNVIAIYRDGSLSNTDSISFYTVSTSGSPTNLLLGTVYPINIGGSRQVTINLNLLPFNSLFIKNDSASTINNVYLTVLNG
jgi:hypothetical protein